MAKTRHNNLLNTIDELFTNAKTHGVMHLNTDVDTVSGRKLAVEGKELINFGTLGYLGLEQHPKLKDAAIKAIEKYGVQFSASRAYISLHTHKELEDTLAQVFEQPTLVSSTSTSLGHLGVIPSIIGDEDAIILDHHVHASIQNAVKLVQVRGVPVEMVKHNDMNMLVDTIKKLGHGYKKIWYMIDGVFSMYGDLPDTKHLIKLLDEHEQLHLYVDDAHGISWAGKHGRGYTLSQVDYHPKLILTATMGKAFGVAGGIFTFPDEEMARKVKTFGGAMSFSVPAPPPVLAASLASAQIHLSDEIYVMQKELSDRINYCNNLIRQTELPLFAYNSCPIFFIEVGKPSVGYNLVRRVMDEGYFVNLAIFPAVPVRHTGIRFSISRNVTMPDIKGLVDALNFHYPKALEEEAAKLNRTVFPSAAVETKLNVATKKTINEVPKEKWNTLFGGKGFFDWDSLEFIEKVFQNNERPEYNWNFYYTIIEDNEGKVVVASVYSNAMWKEDMLAQASISKQIEKTREKDFYYLTSNVITLGTFISEGEHLYVDKKHPQWKKAVSMLIGEIEENSRSNKASGVVLRDFNDNDEELKNYFISKGYVKVDMPESCVSDISHWNTLDEYINTLSYRSRQQLRRDILKLKDEFDVQYKSELSEHELDWAYELQMNVKNRNFDINTFDYPRKLFTSMMKNEKFEAIVINLKPEFDTRQNRKPVAVVFSYKSTSGSYIPLVIGMDYDYIFTHHIYRQSLYRIIMRAKELGYKNVNLGLSAVIEKKKLGAQIYPRVAYVQMNDNFNLEMIGQMIVKNEP